MPSHFDFCLSIGLYDGEAIHRSRVQPAIKHPLTLELPYSRQTRSESRDSPSAQEPKPAQPMTTISASTNIISPANERVYHQSNLLGDWKGTSKQNNMPVEFKVLNIRGDQAQVEYTHNGHTERGLATVDGATINFGDVTIATRNGSQAAFEFSTGTAKWDAILTKQSQTTDQSKLVGTWNGSSVQSGSAATFKVISVSGLDAQVQYTVNGVMRQGIGIVSKNSVMFGGATMSTTDGTSGSIVFTVGHKTYSVAAKNKPPSTTSSSVNTVA
jgi:hypothetical protein